MRAYLMPIPLLCLAVSSAQIPGTFTATGSMFTPRFGHTATVLPDGRVLIAGCNIRCVLGPSCIPATTAELYDSASGTFSAAGTMNTIQPFGGILLPDGKVFFVDGFPTGGRPRIELYDPSSGEFKITGVSPSLSIVWSAALLYAGAGYGYGLFKSFNGGSGWQASSAGIKAVYPAESIAALAVDPQIPTNLFAATSGVECGYGAGGVFRSTDGSTNWTDSGVVSCVNSVSIDPQTPSTVYASTAYSGILKSTDGGQNWTPRNTGLPASTLPGPDATALTIDPQRPTTLYGAISVWDGQAHTALFKSVDGALTWKPTGLQIGMNANAWISSLAIDSRSTDIVFAANVDGSSGRGALWKSTDGGMNWRNLFSSMPVNV